MAIVILPSVGLFLAFVAWITYKDSVWFQQPANAFHPDYPSRMKRLRRLAIAGLIAFLLGMATLVPEPQTLYASTEITPDANTTAPGVLLLYAYEGPNTDRGIGKPQGGDGGHLRVG